MASMVDAARTAVMSVVAHCLSIGGKVAAVRSRALAFAMRRAGAKITAVPLGADHGIDLDAHPDRYFLNGVAIGFKAFVTMNFEATREYFGGKRRDGARPMRKIDTKLYTMRDLQKDPVHPCGMG